MHNDFLNTELYLENIIERIPYHIFWKNADCVYLGCNQRFAELIGRAPRDIIGKTDFDFGWGEGKQSSIDMVISKL